MGRNHEKNVSWWSAQKSIFVAAFWTFSLSAISSQYGPVFPTHNFPTDQSFHAVYRLGFHNSASNFVDTFSTDVLPSGQSIRSIDHLLTVEYQPNRQFNFGAILAFDQMKLNDGTGSGVGKSGMGDQRIFAEFRFYDQPGTSIGLANVTKFSFYKVPTAQELADSSNPTQTALLGDGQLDGSLLLTGEHWPIDVIRLRSDVGMNFRSQGYASEVIYQVGAGFVTPKMDLDLRVKGAFPVGAGGDFSGLTAVKDAFAGSDFALSPNARQFILNPSLSLWLSPKASFHFDFEMSFAGKNSANFMGFVFGLGYRWAKTKPDRPRTFQEVDIHQNLDGNRFEAEEGKSKDEPPKPREPVYDEGDIIYE
jgi:hypothetical protein